MHSSLDFYYFLLLSLCTPSPSHIFVEHLILYHTVVPVNVTEV